MAQQCAVIQGDPQSVVSQLINLNGNILIVEKTTSSGKFIVIYDTIYANQTFTIISGDPSKLALEISSLITLGKIIDLITPTFSSSQYIVVST
jgi:hypothetical protein